MSDPIITEIPSHSMQLLPPAPHLCQECACEHGEHEPHNAQSLFYQVRFNMMQGRAPTWRDAMSHCDEKMQELWAVALTQQGIEDLDGSVNPKRETEMDEDIQPSERLRGEDAEISEKRGDANRVTLDHIIDRIKEKEFVVLGETYTICHLTMVNGFHVSGYSAPADPTKFDAEIGKSNAYDMAIRSVWQLEGYLLREKLWRDEQRKGAQDVADKLAEAGH